MVKKFEAIGLSVKSILDQTEKARTISAVGKLLLPLRSEKLMRENTFSNAPLDCINFAVEDLLKEDFRTAQQWLDQARKAFVGKDRPKWFEKLAEAIRLDVLIQLNGSNLTNTVQIIDNLTKALNSDDPLVEKNPLAYELSNQTTLKAYFLAHDLELSKKAIQLYTEISERSNPALQVAIEQRCQILRQHSYLNPIDFDMSQSTLNNFLADEHQLTDYILNICLNNDLRRRPEFDATNANKVLTVLGWTIIGIPFALMAYPFLVMGDRKDYAKDQAENESYYRILDQANAWRIKFLKNVAEERYPELARMIATLEHYQPELKQQYKCLETYSISKPSALVERSFYFEKLTSAQKENYNKTNAQINQDKVQFLEIRAKFETVYRETNSLLGDMKNTSRLIQQGSVETTRNRIQEKFDNIMSQKQALMGQFEIANELGRTIPIRMDVARDTLYSASRQRDAEKKSLNEELLNQPNHFFY